MTSKKQAGFSLIEAIVALTILSIGTVTLYSWFAVAYDGLLRINDRQDMHEVLRNFEVQLYMMNPQRESEGVYVFNDYQVAWNLWLLEPESTGVYAAGTPSNFDLGLYSVEFEVSRDGRTLGQFSTRKAGYRVSRDLFQGGS